METEWAGKEKYSRRKKVDVTLPIVHQNPQSEKNVASISHEIKILTVLYKYVVPDNQQIIGG